MTGLKKVNTSSIKIQLTVWYALTIFFISSTLFAGFYFITKKALLIETDRSLYNHATQISYEIGLNTNNIFDDQTKEILDVVKTQLPGIFLLTTDINGHSFETISDEFLPFQDLVKKAINTKKPSYEYEIIGQTKLRFISIPVKNGNNIIGAVVMGHPVDVYTQTLSHLKSMAYAIIIFLAIPTILLGHVLAERFIKPIVNISTEMERINPENLTERVEVNTKSTETKILAYNFNKLLDRLDEAFNREKQFIGDVAHEIKTPLTVIKSGAEVTLAKKRKPEEYISSLNQILNHIDKLSKRLTDLISLAWAQTNNVQNQFTNVNLSNILMEICENIQTLTAAKNIKINTNIQGSIHVKGIEDKLAQAFYNLIDNAVKFTTDNGNIRINTLVSKNNVIIEIINTGKGINKKEISHIFEKFYRANNSIGIEGHGLGLTIVKSIIYAHGGNITVTSLENVNTTFKISLSTSS